jgi:hypothetical protein
MTHQLFPLSKIKPNPYRQMDRYPISEEKIEALMGSMDRTGFWDNVIGRIQNGSAELAYGHHRLIAFKQKFGKRAKMNLIIRDLSEEDMLRIMADENADEYGTSATVEQETIRAVVDAYAEGKIELEKPSMSRGGASSVRYAPHFAKGERFTTDKSFPYNAESIARFLGWMTPGGQVSPRVRNALAALEAAEELDAPKEVAEISAGLTSDKANEVVRQVRRVKKERQGGTPRGQGVGESCQERRGWRA